MSTKGLPQNATIASVRDRLRLPEDYVCGVLRNMQAWCTTNGGQRPFVSISIMGDGKYPNYRLCAPLDSDDLIFTRGYNGRSHTSLQGVYESNIETCSMDLMTRSRVEALLGEIRSVKRKGIT